MAQTVNVNFKLDPEVKRGMEQACADMGLSMSAAFTIFAKKVSYVYGMAKAEDTGMRGDNKLDLYMDTYAECINFGRRDCKVYILN